MAPWKTHFDIGTRVSGQSRNRSRSRQQSDHPTTLHALLVLSPFWHLNRGRTSQKPDPRFQRNSPRIKGDELYVKSLSSCTQPVDNLGLWHSTCRLAAQNAALNL